MTAIGFLLLVIFLPLCIFCARAKVESLGVLSVFGSFVGAFLLVLGVTKWLWETMP